MKKRQLPTQNNAEINEVGTPQIFSILQAARVEPLNHPFTIKLPETLAKYIAEGPGPEFIREAILEKLQRIVDQPSPAVCGECVNLDLETYADPFCLVLTAFLQRKHLKQKWSCEYFQRKREAKK